MVQAVIRSKNIVVPLGAALALLLAVACSSDSADNRSPSNITELLSAAGGSSAAAQLLQSGFGNSTGISVNGTGKAKGDPDLGIISLGVESLADTASEARNAAAVAIDSTISVLRANSISDRDMQTSQFSINPRYNTQEIRRCTEASRDLEDLKPPTGGPALGVPAPSSPEVVEMIVIEEEKGTECRTEFERVLIGY